MPYYLLSYLLDGINAKACLPVYDFFLPAESLEAKPSTLTSSSNIPSLSCSERWRSGARRVQEKQRETEEAGGKPNGRQFVWDGRPLFPRSSSARPARRRRPFSARPRPSSGPCAVLSTNLRGPSRPWPRPSPAPYSSAPCSVTQWPRQEAIFFASTLNMCLPLQLGSGSLPLLPLLWTCSWLCCSAVL
jgi:hypothetical protein